MPNRDSFDPENQDVFFPSPELEADESALESHDMTDPATGDVDSILREIRGDMGAPEASQPVPPPAPGPGGEEFRDQEYRDALDENFERAFLEASGEVPPQEAPDVPSVRRRHRRRPRRKPIKKKGSGLLGIPHFLSTMILWAMAIAVGVTLAQVLWLCADDLLALTKEEKLVSVVISDTDTMSDISQKLADAGLVRYPELFNLYCKITGAREKISSGEFSINGIYDYHAMVNAMSGYSSDRKEVEVMIPEGYECRQIFELLEKNGVCTVAELEEAASNGDLGEFWFLEDVERGTPYCLEGFLFPDTYQFYTSDDPERVLRKLLRNFDYRFDEDMESDIADLNVWYGAKLEAFGYDEEYIKSQYFTVRDVVSIASMIERETAGSGESATIASVIYNRLADPDFPYLNIDATIQYALGERKANLSIEDTQIDSPYNTYTNPGLPVGPIANPGLNSLNAALHPKDTDYYWYALGADGTHHFSETEEEHYGFLASLNEDDDEE